MCDVLKDANKLLIIEVSVKYNEIWCPFNMQIITTTSGLFLESKVNDTILKGPKRCFYFRI